MIQSRDRAGPKCEKCGIRTNWLKAELVDTEKVNIFQCGCCEKLLAESAAPKNKVVSLAVKLTDRQARPSTISPSWRD